MRYCQQCGDQFEGRANKVFCSTTCKSQHFRDNPAPAPEPELSGRSMPAPAPAARAAVRPVPEPPAPVPEDDDDDEDLGSVIDKSILNYYRLQAQEAERQAQEVQARREELHGRYDDAVRQFLKLSGRVVKVKEVKRVLLVVEEVQEAYAGHPEAHRDGTAPAVRMEWLEDMVEELRDLVDAARPRTSFWGNSVEAPTAVEVEWEEDFQDELFDSLNGAH